MHQKVYTTNIRKCNANSKSSKNSHSWLWHHLASTLNLMTLNCLNLQDLKKTVGLRSVCALGSIMLTLGYQVMWLISTIHLRQFWLRYRLSENVFIPPLGLGQLNHTRRLTNHGGGVDYGKHIKAVIDQSKIQIVRYHSPADFKLAYYPVVWISIHKSQAVCWIEPVFVE